MRFGHLSRLFHEWGWQITHDSYVEFSDYLKEMLKKNRVIVIERDSEIEGVILFYLTDEYSKVYQKKTWEVVEDNPNGHLMYIDKMICKKFSREVHMAIHDAILEKYPHVEEAMYLRFPRNRRITIKPRSKPCLTR